MKFTRIEEHYDCFMSQPDVERHVELYCCILENKSNDWRQLYYGLMNEISKDRRMFVTPNEQLKEYGEIRDLIENETDNYSKKCLITALFDALMLEKIKTYSLKYTDSLMLNQKLHKYYLIENA